VEFVNRRSPAQSGSPAPVIQQVREASQHRACEPQVKPFFNQWSPVPLEILLSMGNG
jgi:hypothetical protein